MIRLITLPTKAVKTGYQFANYTNEVLAHSLTWLFEKTDSKDPYGIGRAFLHGAILIGTPYLLARANGYLLYPLDLPVWLGGLFFTAKAWNEIYRHKEQPDTFGDARFAELKELKKAGLVGESGIVFGKMEGNLVVKPEKLEGHIIVLGGPKSGKTSGFVIPSLYRWGGSALVFDPKGGEIAKKTGVIRSRHQKVYVFNPTDPDCHQYNPLDFCDTTDKALSMSQVLIPLQNEKYAFFTECARGIVAAALLEGHIQRKSLPEVCEKIILTAGEDLANHYLNHQNAQIKMLASPLLHLPTESMGSVMSELVRNLNVIAADENIRRNTSRSDWDMSELEDKSTIYLSIPEEKLKLPQYRKLFNIIINQAVDHLTEREEKKDPPILIMIDELYTLGKIPSLVQSLATLRSRNVHISMAFQSLSQLDEVYGIPGRKMIMDICTYKMVLNVSDPDTQRYFEKLAGQKTVFTTSMNAEEDEKSKRLSEVGTPLVRSEKWRTLEKPIFFSDLEHPAELERIQYWQDRLIIRIMRKDLRELEKRVANQEQILDQIEEKIGNVVEIPERRKEAQ